MKEFGGMTDEQLMRYVDEVKSWKEADSIEPDASDVDKCVSDLRTSVDVTQIVPVCMFSIIFRTDCAVHKFEVLIDEKRNVTLVGVDLFKPDVSTQCKHDELLDVLGLVMDKNNDRKPRNAI